jgi:hypothetical protein
MAISAFYLPAIAYRWSLKASAWLWWPLALALTPPFEGLDGSTRRERAAEASKGVWTWIFPALLPPAVMAWLLLALRPDIGEWLALLSPEASEHAQKFLTLLAPPPFGLRYGLLWLFAILALALAVVRHNFVAAYDKVLGSPKEFRDLQPEERERFDAGARRVERLRLGLIVTLFLLGEAVALAFLHGRNPAEVERLVWPWLLESL